MVANWWLITLSLASLGRPLVASALDCTAGLINKLSTSTEDGYIEDEATGINFFFRVGPFQDTISLSWFVPQMDRTNISFLIYKNANTRFIISNISTAEVNGTRTIECNLNDAMNLHLTLKMENRTTRYYCCVLVDCMVLPPPDMLTPIETRDSNDKFSMTFEGKNMGYQLFDCEMRYWETDNRTVKHFRCMDDKGNCTLHKLPPNTNFEAQMGCAVSDITIHPKRIQWSQPIPFSSSQIIIVPGEVADTKYTENATDVTRSVLISWKEPVDEMQRYGVILYYTVTLRGIGPPTCVEHKEARNISQLSYTFKGLDHNCQYSINITASNEAGEGLRHIENVNIGKPTKPNLTALSITSKTLTLGWNPPQRSYGQITYNLTLKIGETVLESIDQLTPNSTSSENGEPMMMNYTFRDLKPYTTYEVALTVQNRAKRNSAKLTELTTLQAAPSASPTSLTAMSRPGHPTELDITWTSVPTNRSNGIIIFYTIYWWSMQLNEGCRSDTATDDTMFSENMTDDGQRSCSIHELTSNSTYCIAMTASTVAGEGPNVTTSASTVKDFITVNITIKEVTHDSVSLEWQLSTKVDISEVSTVLAVDGKVYSNFTDTSSYLLEHLDSYTAYNVSLRACWLEYKLEGCGPFTHKDVMTNATKPSAPQKLQVNQLGQGWVNLSWAVPALTGGPISSYRVVYYDALSGGAKTEDETTNLNIPDIKLSCPKFAALEYVFEVSAVDIFAELEGPPAKKYATVCSKRKVLGIIVAAVVIVPCGIICISFLLIWWFFCYPKKKIEIKVSRVIYHPKLMTSTSKCPEKEVFDMLKAKSDVKECETYMIMKAPVKQSPNDDYTHMSKTYISEAT